MKKGLFISVLASAATAVVALSAQAGATGPVLTDVFLTITGGDLSIGVTGSLDLGTFTVSSSSQTVEGDFTAATDEEYFWVEDLKGVDVGWYTTLQASAMSGANGTIPAANISLKVDPATVSLLAGTANARVELASAWASYRVADTPLVFIERDTGNAEPAGPNNGVIGWYGVLPSVQVVIPAYQSVGAYTSVLTYTLFEN